MKTKLLIKLLTEADPSGELECCIGNADLSGVYKENATAGGWYQVIFRDDTGPVKVRLIGRGQKIILEPYPLEYALCDNPELTVELDGNDKDGKNRLRVAHARDDARKQALEPT